MASSKNQTLTTTAASILATDDVMRTVCLHSKGTLYLGGEGVTVANGYRMDNGDKLTIEIYQGEVLYGITSASTSDISVLEFAQR
jgi:protein involved in polysaccharide export with SLBB domain